MPAKSDCVENDGYNQGCHSRCQRETPGSRQVVEQEDPVAETREIRQGRAGHSRQLHLAHCQDIEGSQCLDGVSAGQEMPQPQGKQSSEPVSCKQMESGTEQGCLRAGKDRLQKVKHLPPEAVTVHVRPGASERQSPAGVPHT